MTADYVPELQAFYEERLKHVLYTDGTPVQEGDKIRYHQAPGGLLQHGDWQYGIAVLHEFPLGDTTATEMVLEADGKHYNLCGHVIERTEWTEDDWTWARDLKPGDVYYRQQYTGPDIAVTIIERLPDAEDRFGRTMMAFKCRREDLGREGTDLFGPEGKVHRAPWKLRCKHCGVAVTLDPREVGIGREPDGLAYCTDPLPKGVSQFPPCPNPNGTGHEVDQ